MAFFSTVPLDARDEQKKEFLKDPSKVGRPNLFHKISIDYETMVEEEYWDPDWRETDDVPAFKEAMAKKATAEGSSGSVAQRMKARRAQASSTPSRGVVGDVNLDDSDGSSQGDKPVAEGEDKETREPTPKPPSPPTRARRDREENPQSPDPVVGMKRGARAMLGDPRSKKPQICRAPTPRYSEVGLVFVRPHNVLGCVNNSWLYC